MNIDVPAGVGATPFDTQPIKGTSHNCMCIRCEQKLLNHRPRAQLDENMNGIHVYSLAIYNFTLRCVHENI